MSLYDFLIEDGDMCFDIGANHGNSTMLMLRAGAGLVVAVEPQASLANELRNRFASDERVVVEEYAVSDKIGTAYLVTCQADTLATLEDRWTRGRFASYTWNRRSPQAVATLTLDYMIDAYGVPQFCAIDAEGHDVKIIQGLSHHIPIISFEYMTEFWETSTLACLEWLDVLGGYEYNAVIGEIEEYMERDASKRFMDGFLPLNDFINFAHVNLLSDGCWGNLYARLTNESKNCP